MRNGLPIAPSTRGPVQDLPHLQGGLVLIELVARKRSGLHPERSSATHTALKGAKSCNSQTREATSRQSWSRISGTAQRPRARLPITKQSGYKCQSWGAAEIVPAVCPIYHMAPSSIDPGIRVTYTGGAHHCCYRSQRQQHRTVTPAIYRYCGRS